MTGVVVREAVEADWPAIWPIVQAVAAAGETYAYPRDLDETLGRELWMRPAPWRVLVAVDADGQVLGSAKSGPNQLGPGAHVANASFVVSSEARGRGVGRTLGEAVIARAAADGYRAMQFNAVVEANHAAVRLWRALGFRIVATVPEAFDHPTQGLVGLHVMHRML